MKQLELSKNNNCFIFLKYDEDEDDNNYWFCPARFELIDYITFMYLLLSDEQKDCIQVKKVKRVVIQNEFFEQAADVKLRLKWRKCAKMCANETGLEKEFWDLVEADYSLECDYLEFEKKYLLSYAADWCRENNIPYIITENRVESPAHPPMFIDQVESILSYLKAGWSIGDYMELLRNLNPGVKDFSAFNPAIKVAQERMKKSAHGKKKSEDF